MYYKVGDIIGENVDCTSKGEEYEISKDVIMHDMHNSAVFAKEEKLALTKVVKLLREANTTVFTICFTCKVDEKEVQEKLKKISEKDFKDAKSLAKQIFIGREKTSVARLSKSENHLGRSLVLDLASGGRIYALVDHRNIKWVILKNVKYIVN